MRTTPVILIILAVFAGLLLISVILFFAVRVKAVIIYNADDGFRLRVSVLSFKILDSEEKDGEEEGKKVRVSDFRLDRIKRKKKKAAKKKIKASAERERQPWDINNIIKIIRLILSTFFDRYAKFLSVKAVRLKIGVATGDAASTAILYGIVVQGVAYIIEIINNITNLKSLRFSEINVYPDYISESFSADIKIVLRLPVWCTVSVLLKSGIFSSGNNKDNK